MKPYNELQEKLLERFIDAGGVGMEYQNERGAGYSTFIIAQCIQQALTTSRDIIFVTDVKDYHVRHEFAYVAKEMFDLDIKYDISRNVVHIGHNRVRIVKPDTRGDRLRGYSFHDVFGEFDRDTIDRNEDFFYTLVIYQRQGGRGGSDGTGFRYFIVR